VGITMLGVVAVVALIRRGWRVALAVAALPAIVYAWWYLAYGRDAPDVTTLSYRTVPGFVWDGLTDALGDVVRLRGMGVVIVLAVFVWLVCQLRHRPFPRTLLVPAVLALGALVSLALTGWRRGNITVPSTSRYAYITIVLVLPLVAAAAEWLVRRVARERFLRVVPVVTGVLLLVIAIAQVRIFDNYVDSIQESKRVEKAAFLTTALLVREGHLLLDDQPMYVAEPQVTAAKIAALDRDGKLPSLTGLRLGDRYTVLARLDLVLAADHLSGILPNPTAVRLGKVHGAQTEPVAGRADCVALESSKPGATAQLLTDGKVAVGLLGDGLLALRVARPDGRVQGEDIYATLHPKAERVLNVGPIEAGAVVLTLPEGTTRVCGIS